MIRRGRKTGEPSGNPNGAEQESPPLKPEKEEMTSDNLILSDYDVEQIEDAPEQQLTNSLMEGNEHSANINRIPVLVRFNNGNMSRELGATAEQEAEQLDLDKFFKDVQFRAEDLHLLDEVIDNRNSTKFDATAEQEANNMLVEELVFANTNGMGMNVDLGTPLWNNEYLEFASQVPQGMMGNAPEQQLGEATTRSDKESYDDNMDFWRSLGDLM